MLHTLRHPAEEVGVGNAVFSPDGTLVVTLTRQPLTKASPKGTGRIWETATGTLLRTLAAPGSFTWKLAAASTSVREVLALMAEGRTNRGIARRLWLTDRTVETHIASILAKLGVGADEEDHRQVPAVLAFLNLAPELRRIRALIPLWHNAAPSSPSATLTKRSEVRRSGGSSLLGLVA